MWKPSFNSFWRDLKDLGVRQWARSTDRKTGKSSWGLAGTYRWCALNEEEKLELHLFLSRSLHSCGLWLFKSHHPCTGNNCCRFILNPLPDSSPGYICILVLIRTRIERGYRNGALCCWKEIGDRSKWEGYFQDLAPLKYVFKCNQW